MKDYSLDRYEAKSFILNYTVEGEEMIIHYASGEVRHIPYTLENKEMILEKMEEQVLNSYDLKKEQRKRI